MHEGQLSLRALKVKGEYHLRSHLVTIDRIIPVEEASAYKLDLNPNSELKYDMVQLTRVGT